MLHTDRGTLTGISNGAATWHSDRLAEQPWCVSRLAHMQQPLNRAQQFTIDAAVSLACGAQNRTELVVIELSSLSVSLLPFQTSARKTTIIVSKSLCFGFFHAGQ